MKKTSVSAINTYEGLQKGDVQNIPGLALWQKQMLDERLNDNYRNTTSLIDFDKTIDDIEKSL